MSEAAPRPDEAGAAPARSGVRLWEHGVTLGVAIAIALGLRACVIEPFRIPSSSMLPTLMIGDHLFVSRFHYGVRLPLGPLGELRLPGVREPARGDVIVFSVARDGLDTVPADRGPNLPQEQFVKRIVGLPGDRIEFRDGEPWVNGAPLPKQPGPEPVRDELGRELRAFEITLPERRFVVADDPEVPPPTSEPIEVEPGRYFVMGDNRDHSEDSRFWGTVGRDAIRGPAVVLYWSWNFQGGWGSLLDPRTWWRTEKRWDRIGRAL